MAKATPKMAEKVVQKIEKVQDGVTLELNHEEAQFIADIVSLVGGGAGTRQVYAQILEDVLRVAGYHWKNTERGQKYSGKSDIAMGSNITFVRPQ